MSVVLEEKIKHYQRNLERCHQDPYRLLHCIEQLSRLPVTVLHLKSTGVGRTVNALRKIDQGVGTAAKILVAKWKEMVSNTRSSNDEDETCVPDAPDSYESPEYERKQEKITAQNSGIYNNEPEALKNEISSPLGDIEINCNDDSFDYLNDVKEESRNKILNQSSSSKDKSFKKDENRKSQKNKHSRQDYSKISKDLQSSGNKNKHKSKYNNCPAVSSNKEKKHLLELKRRYTNSDDGDDDDDDSDDCCDQKRRKESSNEEEKSDDDLVINEHNLKEEIKEENDNYDEDKEIDEEKLSVYKESSRKDANYSDKVKSKDKHRSSSSSRSKSKESSDKLKKSEKNSSLKSRDHDKESSKSKKSHSSSNGKDRLEFKEKDKQKKKHGKDKKSDKEKISKSRETKEFKDDQKKNKEKNEQKKIKRLSEETENDTGTNSLSFAEALGMCPMPPKTKKKKESPNSSINLSKSNNKLDQPSTSSLASTSSSSSSSKNKSSSKIKTEPVDDTESLPLLSPNVKLKPLSKLNEDVDLAATLPEPSLHYRPLPQINHVQRKLEEDQMLSQVIHAKNQRTKVYSGNKIGCTTLPSLYDMCIRVLIENIEALEFTGGVPYYIIKPILERATPDQLFMLEHHNPYLMEDSDVLWQFHCNKDFRTKKREEMESWREMYLRCLDEREAKLKALTANIKQSIDKSTPVRSTKLAYIDHVVKPPRNVLRQQAKYGTASSTSNSFDLKKKLIATASGSSSTLAAERIFVPPPPQARVQPIKKMKAPLMAKALQAIKGRYKR